jgi:4-hydroxybenzoate polyprenyltransferase
VSESAEELPPVHRDVLPIAAIKALRPKQWTKNVLLFAALVFSISFTDPKSLALAGWGFACFCLVSSSGYLINDILDREADAKHPEKRQRPIASGALPVPVAWVLAILCLIGGMVAGFFLAPGFALVAGLYWANTMTYSVWGKHQVILDIFMISGGFLFRAVAGAIAIQVAISPWLLLCAGFFALFLGFNKRRGELMTVGAGAQRRNLKLYSHDLLEEIQAVTSSGTVISYALYTVLGSPTPWLLITLPLPLFAIFRYMHLVHQGKTGDPSKVLLKDKPILVICVIYAVSAMAILLFAPAEGAASGWLLSLDPVDTHRP